MSDNFSSSIDDLDSTQTSKCAQDLSTYIDNKFPTEPPSLDAILNDYPYLTKLGHLTMNLLRTLINNGLTDESFSKVDFAIRTMVFEKCNLDVSNLKSQMSLNSIRSMTNSSIDSANSSPYAIKNETIQEIRRLNEELQSSKKRELHLEDEIRSQKNEIKRQEDENIRLTTLLSSNRTQSNGQQCNLQIEIMNLKDEIERQKENVSFAEEREKRLNDRISELNQDKDELDKRISELQATIQTKKEKISSLKLNEKKLKHEIQNERLNSSKLQAELEMQLKLQNEKADKNGNSAKLVDLVDRYQKILNERDVDNAFLAQKLTSLSNYAQQLINISEELEDRLSMAEEDKEVNISLINQLKSKISALAKENQQKQDELLSTQGELQTLKDMISKFEKETGISINSDDIQAILKNRFSKSAANNPEKFVELEKIIASILRYLNMLMIGDGDVFPLICRSEPILESQEIRQSIISSIEDLKVTLSLTNDVTDVPTLLDKVLSNDEGIQNLLSELEAKDEYTEYAAISVLCSANSNIRRFLESTAESLTELHKLLPIEYRESDIIQSISKYLHDSQALFGLIFEAMNNNTLFRSEEILFYPMMKTFIEQTSDLLHNLDCEVRPTIRFRGKMVDMPNEIANYIEAQDRLIESLKSNGNENTYIAENIDSSDNFILRSRDIKLDDHISQLEDEKSNLLQKIDVQAKDYSDQIEALTQKLNEEISKRKLAEQNLELTQKGAQEALMKAKIVEKERDDLLELTNKRKKLFAQRKAAIIENERLNYEELLRRERKKFENEKQAIIQTLDAKTSRYKSLKRRYAEMEAMYEKQSSYQSSKIVELINNIRIIGEKTTQQAEEREKRHESEVRRLEDKVARILSLADSNKNNNDENTEMMDSTIIDSEKIPPINKSNAPSAIYLTPNKSGIDALNMSENMIEDLNNSAVNSARLGGSRNSECDRFVAQVGRALSKYTKDEGPWTRSRILSSIPRLFSRLAELEKTKTTITGFDSTSTQPYNTPQPGSTLTPTINRNRSMSLTISKTTPNRFTSTNENTSEFDLSSNLLNSSTINDSVQSASKPPLKIAAALNEQRDWQSWAIDIALRLNISPRSPNELRTELRDIIFSANAKSQLVKMITSLREQKKLLKNFQLQILFPHVSEDSSTLNRKNLKFRSLVLFVRSIMIEKRLASKAALNQLHTKQQIKNSPRFSLQFSPRTTQTQL
ncbi:hypothetical protein M9Y10_033762 [Tritrichomonas musculus]|uniref:Uncharacterized protein n=1 Tax=Tritrichomonas musculus TaxID=1915356 RepID=A0ABR2KD17_9EUKA